jgi:hypothetical protein
MFLDSLPKQTSLAAPFNLLWGVDGMTLSPFNMDKTRSDPQKHPVKTSLEERDGEKVARDKDKQDAVLKAPPSSPVGARLHTQKGDIFGPAFALFCRTKRYTVTTLTGPEQKIGSPSPAKTTFFVIH